MCRARVLFSYSIPFDHLGFTGNLVTLNHVSLFVYELSIFHLHFCVPSILSLKYMISFSLSHLSSLFYSSRLTACITYFMRDDGVKLLRCTGCWIFGHTLPEITHRRRRRRLLCQRGRSSEIRVKEKRQDCYFCPREKGRLSLARGQMSNYSVRVSEGRQ